MLIKSRCSHRKHKAADVNCLPVQFYSTLQSLSGFKAFTKNIMGGRDRIAMQSNSLQPSLNLSTHHSLGTEMTRDMLDASN